VPKKGFVEAVNLRAGDILCTVNGEYVIVEQIQHEILEAPIKVYNFRVGNNHTYYVGNVEIGVYNAPCVEIAQYGEDFGKMGKYVEKPNIKVDCSQYADHGTKQMQNRGITKAIVDYYVENGIL
jgi:hypothetical protein